MLKSEYDWQFRTESSTACLAYPNGCLRPRGKTKIFNHVRINLSEWNF